MMERTPLPKIALTPRSQASPRSGIPQFPSPTDFDDFSSPFLSPPTPATESTSLFSSSRPDSSQVNLSFFDFGRTRGPPVARQSLFMPTSVEPVGTAVVGAPSPSNASAKAPQKTARSLLKPSTSNGSIQGLFEDGEVDETGSLSASEDGDAFFLVPPSAVKASVVKDNQPSKQRRILTGSPDEGPPLASRNESSSSLLGAALLASNSTNSLLGMDGESTRSATRSNSFRLAASRLNRNESPRRETETPPLMQQPSSPPPLHRSEEIYA